MPGLRLAGAVYRKSKIPELPDLMAPEDIGRLDISVQHPHFKHVLGCFDYITDDTDGFFFAQLPIVGHILQQIPVRAELCDKEAMSGIFVYIFEPNDIRMTQFFYYLYLIFEHFQTGGRVLFQLDHFYREIPLPLGASALVDVACVPRTDFVTLSVAVVADGFRLILEAHCLLA